MIRIDARLLLRFGPLESRLANEAILIEGDAIAAAPSIRVTPSPAGHVMDCACCTPRSAAARALADLFRQRATENGPMFQAVLAVVGPEVECAVRTALIADPVVAARYRLVVRT